MTISRVVGLVLGVAVLGIAYGQAAAEPPTTNPQSVDVGSLPRNQWTRLAGEGVTTDYSWSGPVYAPTRGQVLQWGGVMGKRGHNDVLALDAATGRWVSDYPSTANNTVMTGGGGGTGGVSYTGLWKMLPSGVPLAANTVYAGCWDSKRERLVYAMAGMMAAYDPKTRKWETLPAKTILYGQETPGAPMLYGVGACYDPVNDEIVLFPHFTAKNIDLRDATGQISGHYGTWRFTYTDNTWRRVGDTFGSDAQKKARVDVTGVMTKTSSAMDTVWLLRRKPDPAKAADAAKLLEAAAQEAAKLAISGESATQSATIGGLLKSASADVSAGRLDPAMPACRDALWAMNDLLDGALRVEPQARCAAPMVYDEKNKCIVMFGGHDGFHHGGTDGPNAVGRCDTWLYDCPTRQWRQVAGERHPPRQRMPRMAYDPQSGLVILVQTSGSLWDKAPHRGVLWTLDVAKGEWSKRHEQTWPGRLALQSVTGDVVPSGMMAFDPKARLLVAMEADDSGNGQGAYAMKLDLGKLPAELAPAVGADAGPRPHTMPDDDPACLERLKSLPANTWVAAKPPAEIARRDWGNISVDPVRGWVVYFGGGHSTYQWTTVAVYAVGANQWRSGPGAICNFIPPVGWEGCTIDFRGGLPPYHQLNAYQAFDGRSYHYVGTNKAYQACFEDQKMVRFYDIDRGGVWREMPLANVTRTPADAPLSQGQSGPQMADASGLVMSLLYGVSGTFRSYDANTNELTVRKVEGSIPGWREQCRPMCYAPDRGQILWCGECGGSRDGKRPNRTWIYDIKTNQFTDAQPKHIPPGLPRVVEYLPRHKLAMAAVPAGDRAWTHWVYSFEKNDWAELSAKASGMGMQAPYGQMVWVEKYGVFVNFDGRTWLMRPDFSQMKWD